MSLTEPKVFSLEESNDFVKEFSRFLSNDKPNLFVCIGTPNVLFDSIGPRVGTSLQFSRIKVAGTLENPIHRLTYLDFYNKIHSKLDKYNIIAIDSAITDLKSAHYKICINRGGIQPAAAIEETLPPIGDFYIKALFPPKVLTLLGQFDPNVIEFTYKCHSFLVENILLSLSINKDLKY